MAPSFGPHNTPPGCKQLPAAPINKVGVRWLRLQRAWQPPSSPPLAPTCPSWALRHRCGRHEGPRCLCKAPTSKVGVRWLRLQHAWQPSSLPFLGPTPPQQCLCLATLATGTWPREGVALAPSLGPHNTLPGCKQPPATLSKTPINKVGVHWLRLQRAWQPSSSPFLAPTTGTLQVRASNLRAGCGCEQPVATISQGPSG